MLARPPEQSWLLMSQCKSLTRRFYPSLSQHSSHVSFFLCQAHHEWERGETGELFASPPPGGSGRHQPLSLVTEGREQGGEVKCETRRGGEACVSFWCAVVFDARFDISTTEVAVCSPPSSTAAHPASRIPTPISSTTASSKVCHWLLAIKPGHKWASQLSRCLAAPRTFALFYKLATNELRGSHTLRPVARSVSHAQKKCAVPLNCGRATDIR